MIITLKRKKYFFITLAIFIFVFLLSNSTYALNLKDAFDINLPKFGTQAGYSMYQTTPEPFIGVIVQATLSLLGIIFIILMIYGGGLWMTAKGNEQQVDKAKDLITAAIIGLIIVVAAYAISYFVIKTIGGSSLKNP